MGRSVWLGFRRRQFLARTPYVAHTCLHCCGRSLVSYNGIERLQCFVLGLWKDLCVLCLNKDFLNELHACTCTHTRAHGHTLTLTHTRAHGHTRTNTPTLTHTHTHTNTHTCTCTHTCTPPQLVYVMPSTSGRAATYPRRVDKLKFFTELKELRDSLRTQGSDSATPTPVTSPYFDAPGQGSGAREAGERTSGSTPV